MSHTKQYQPRKAPFGTRLFAPLLWAKLRRAPPMNAARAWRRFKWQDVPKRTRQLTYVSIGAAFTTATLESKFKECMEIVGNPADVTSPHTLFWLRVLFGRMRSRFVGSAADMRIPVALRSPIYRLFAWRYDVDLNEVRYPLDAFHTFNDFFSRKLLDGARPVAEVPHGLVSPVDAEVLTIGQVTEANARVDQVKGATYNIRSFLGYEPLDVAKRDSDVHFVVLYLSPGNYHRIHSPCEVTLSKGRHFGGELLPVRSWLLQRVNDVLAVNERVVLTGRWECGLMSLVAVGAANVGSIFLDFDHKLKTNRLRDIVAHCGGDVSEKLYPKGVQLGTGESVGGFRMGSTVVLVFESPKNFRWQVSPGDALRVGQPLGSIA